MRAAEKACAKYQEAIKPPELSDEEQAEFKKARAGQRAVHARARRSTFPDPTFDENGGAQIRMSRARASIPESPKFQAAQKACERRCRGRPAATPRRRTTSDEARWPAALPPRRVVAAARSWRGRRRRAATAAAPAAPARDDGDGRAHAISSTARASRARSATRTRARSRRASAGTLTGAARAGHA